MNVDRRGFLLGMGSLAALGGCTGGKPLFARHRSDYAGIQIGVITYSWWDLSTGWSNPGYVGANTVDACLKTGLGTVELMGGDAENAVGLPNNAPLAQRQAVPDAKWLALKAKFDAAGVGIHIVKFGIGEGSDDENAYYAKVAHLLGADTITREVPVVDAKSRKLDVVAIKRCAATADTFGVNVAFHNHTQINLATYADAAMDLSPRLKINFDIGHYVASNDDDPVEFVRRFKDRIASIHLKDRTLMRNGSKNLPFGQGDTPLKRLFDYMAEAGLYDIPCDIEREYELPPGSDRINEVAVCNRHCRGLILG